MTLSQAANFRARLEEKIQSKHLLAHEFYTRWQAGTLSRQELQGYAKEYYQFEKEFPRFVSSLHSRCEDVEMRQQLLENLIHEEQGEHNHPELWLRFAEGVGASREDVKNHFHSDETEHLLRSFRGACQKDGIIEGLAALYAYERQQPDVARTKIEGLQRCYGVHDEAALSFFKAHQTYDVYHAETEVSLLEKLCPDEASKELALKSVETTLGALYDFLDGVTRRYSPKAA